LEGGGGRGALVDEADVEALALLDNIILLQQLLHPGAYTPSLLNSTWALFMG
jgi:hypothetical protein